MLITASTLYLCLVFCMFRNKTCLAIFLLRLCLKRVKRFLFVLGVWTRNVKSCAHGHRPFGSFLSGFSDENNRRIVPLPLPSPLFGEFFSKIPTHTFTHTSKTFSPTSNCAIYSERPRLSKPPKLSSINNHQLVILCNKI